MKRRRKVKLLILVVCPLKWRSFFQSIADLWVNTTWNLLEKRILVPCSMMKIFMSESRYAISNLISSNILYIDSWISDIKRHTINGDMKFFMNLARKCIAMTYMSFYWRVKYLLELKFPPILGKKIFYQKEGTIFLYVYIHFYTRFIISFSLQHKETFPSKIAQSPW